MRVVKFLMRTIDGKAFTFIDENETPHYIDTGPMYESILNGEYGPIADYDPTMDFLNVVVREDAGGES